MVEMVEMQSPNQEKQSIQTVGVAVLVETADQAELLLANTEDPVAVPVGLVAMVVLLFLSPGQTFQGEQVNPPSSTHLPHDSKLTPPFAVPAVWEGLLPPLEMREGLVAVVAVVERAAVVVVELAASVAVVVVVEVPLAAVEASVAVAEHRVNGQEAHPEKAGTA